MSDPGTGNPEPNAPVPPPGDPRAAHGLEFLSPPRSPDEVGRLGPYRVLGVLGRGGMGVVLRAEDPALHRHVALKVMLPAAAARPGARDQFLREARALAAIEHDHVVPVFHVGEEGGVPFIAMPLLRGRSLDRALRDGPGLPMAAAIRVAREVAEGLAAAHARGLIHRDLTPSNIWLEADGGRARLLDFGLAMAPALADADPFTPDGLIGTPGYAAPEQIRGEPVGPRSDLFGLGCVLYRMLAGRPPFASETLNGALWSVLQSTPVSARAYNPVIPVELDGLVARLLAKDPAARPESARAVADELQAVEQALAAPAAAEPPPAEALVKTADSGVLTTVAATGEAPAEPPARRRRWPVVLTGMLAVGAVAAAAQQIIIRVKNPDGTEAEVRVPEGGTVVIEQNGKEAARVGPDQAGPPRAAAPFDATRAKQHQAAWAAYLNRPPVEGGPLGMSFALIPPGEFEVAYLPAGARAFDPKAPRRVVRLTRPYQLAVTEVTVEQFRRFADATEYVTEAERGGRAGRVLAIVGADPKRRYTWRDPGPYPHPPGGPVVNVSAGDAQAFCDWLGRQDGRMYRLPTEAEWEFAARAGGPADQAPADQAGVGPFAGTLPVPAGQSPVGPVGRLKPNPFGLCDVYGGVWERCLDWTDPADVTPGPVEDPVGLSAGTVRGAGWNHFPIEAFAAHRWNRIPPQVNTGFRVLREVVPGKPPEPGIPKPRPVR